MTTQLRAPERKANVGTGWLWIPWFVVLAFALLSALLYFTNLRLKNDLAAIRSDAKAHEADLQQSRAMLDMLKSSSSVRASLRAEGEPNKTAGEAVYDPQNGTLILMASNLPAIPSDKLYQLWLLPERGEAVSAGSFRPDDHGSAALVQRSLPAGMQLKGFAISAEPRGGTDKPTGGVIMQGSVLK